MQTHSNNPQSNPPDTGMRRKRRSVSTLVAHTCAAHTVRVAAAALSRCCWCHCRPVAHLRCMRLRTVQAQQQTMVTKRRQHQRQTAMSQTHRHKLRSLHCHWNSCTHSARCQPEEQPHLLPPHCCRSLCVVASGSVLCWWANHLYVVSASAMSGRVAGRTKRADRARRKTDRLRHSRQGLLRDRTRLVDSSPRTRLLLAVAGNSSAVVHSIQRTGPHHSRHPPRSQPHRHRHRRRHSRHHIRPRQHTGLHSGLQDKHRAVSVHESHSKERVDRTESDRGGVGIRHVAADRRIGVVGRSTWPSRC